MLKKKLCNCKQGVQLFRLDTVDKPVEIDCDDKRLLNIRIEDDFKLDITELQRQGFILDHKLFFNERAKAWTEKQMYNPAPSWSDKAMGWFNSLFE